MAYITYEEYQELGNGSVSEDDFDRYLSRATIIIDDLTRGFYMHNDIDQDIPWRRERFKLALVMQMDYFGFIGGTSTTNLNDAQTVSIGRTSMTKSSDASSSNKYGLISDDAVMTLMPTGLLYRGICTVGW